MRNKKMKNWLTGFLSIVMVLTGFVGIGSTKVRAEEGSGTEYMISFPRSGDENMTTGPGGWGHGELTFMNGWEMGASKGTIIRGMDSFKGQICYCIEPGVTQSNGDIYGVAKEDFWEDYPTELNRTIDPDDIKVLLGRILQYGYRGNITTSWRSQNPEDADKLAHAVATQILVWETIVGERDRDFKYVSPGEYDAVKEVIGTGHPLYSRINAYYTEIEKNVQDHTRRPSFTSRNLNEIPRTELEWNGTEYTATLTDLNHVLDQFVWEADVPGISFRVNGDELTLSTKEAPDEPVRISAYRTMKSSGIVIWHDGVHKGDGIQDMVTFTTPITDPMLVYLKLETSSGNLCIRKTSEDGKVNGISFTVSGTDYYRTVATDQNGEITIENLKAGTYTVSEETPECYLPQQPKSITVVSGKTATVSFENVLKRGDLTVTKTSEDGKVEGIVFRLSGTSLSGEKVDRTAVTDRNGTAVFGKILIGSDYVLEEMDTGEKYIVPSSQKVTIEWDKTTRKQMENLLKKGTVEVTKVSEDQNVGNVRFRLTGTVLGGQEIEQYAETDKTGKAVFTGIPIGTEYLLEEVGTEEWYIVPEPQRISVRWKETRKAVFTNRLKRGDLVIAKTSEDGKISGIEFRLTGISLSGETVEKTEVTDRDGKAVFKDLPIGPDYTVEEIGTENWYSIPEKQHVSVEWNKTAELSFHNSLKKGSVLVTKTSEDGLTEGITFRLTGISDCGISVCETAITDPEGKAEFPDIPIGSGYLLEEVGTDEKYVIPDPQTLNVAWDTVTLKTVENRLKRFRVTVIKTDGETESPQGEGTLAGAVYGIYRGEELIDTYETDENGSFTTDDYPCGEDWTVREIEPSRGYLLSDEILPIGAEGKAYTGPWNQAPDLIAKEQAIKGRIALIKHSDDGSTGIETPETGAEFEIYLTSAGSYDRADETERDHLICDENGFAETKDLPFGIYTVHQAGGWDGRETIKDFTVAIQNNGETVRMLINNSCFCAHIKVIKTDAETGRTVPVSGAAFRIYDPDGNPVTMTVTYPSVSEMDSFVTDESGMLVTPGTLPYGKGYALVEIQAPEGYDLNPSPVFFDVLPSDSAEEENIRVIPVTVSDIPQKGIIRIRKTGEVFETVRVTEGIYQPVYAIKDLEGAVFEIRAAEDIVTPDGTVRLRAEDLADTVTTGKEGTAESRELYPGTYTVREIKAPSGMVLDPAEIIVHVQADKMQSGLVIESVSQTDKRQKAKIRFHKSMETDALFSGEPDEVLIGVSFGLYAAEDIVAADGSKIPEGGLIEVIRLTPEGTAEVRSDLPFGSYYLKERTTDEHYLLSSEMYPAVFVYGGPDTELVTIEVNEGKPIVNELIRGSVMGIKTDETGNGLSGAWIGLFTGNGTEPVCTVETADDGSFSFDDLPYGDYSVREIRAPEGFVRNETEYPVRISANEEKIRIRIVNERICGSVTLTKIDEENPGITLSGAVFTVYRDGTAIGTMSEQENGIYRMEGLPYGDYSLKETEAPEGFLPDENVYIFSIRENGERITVGNNGEGDLFADRAQKGNLLIRKTSEDGVLEGFRFLIEGRTVTGESYHEEFLTDENGEIQISGLRIGEYTVSEIPGEETARYLLPDPVTVSIENEKTELVEVVNRIIPETGFVNHTKTWFILAVLSVIGIGTSVYTFVRIKRDNESDRKRSKNGRNVANNVNKTN